MRKNGGCLLPGCLLSARSRAGRARGRGPEQGGGEGSAARAARSSAGSGDRALPGRRRAQSLPRCRLPSPERRLLLPSVCSAGGSEPPGTAEPPGHRRAPRAAPAIAPGRALAPRGCLKRSGEQGKCRLTAEKMRGLADFVCKKIMMAVVIIVVKAACVGFLRKVREGSGKGRSQSCVRSVGLLRVSGS